MMIQIRRGCFESNSSSSHSLVLSDDDYHMIKNLKDAFFQKDNTLLIYPESFGWEDGKVFCPNSKLNYVYASVGRETFSKLVETLGFDGYEIVGNGEPYINHQSQDVLEDSLDTNDVQELIKFIGNYDSHIQLGNDNSYTNLDTSKYIPKYMETKEFENYRIDYFTENRHIISPTKEEFKMLDVYKNIPSIDIKTSDEKYFYEFGEEDKKLFDSLPKGTIINIVDSYIPKYDMSWIVRNYKDKFSFTVEVNYMSKNNFNILEGLLRFDKYIDFIYFNLPHKDTKFNVWDFQDLLDKLPQEKIILSKNVGMDDCAYGSYVFKEYNRHIKGYNFYNGESVKHRKDLLGTRLEENRDDFLAMMNHDRKNLTMDREAFRQLFGKRYITESCFEKIFNKETYLYVDLMKGKCKKDRYRVDNVKYDFKTIEEISNELYEKGEIE